MRRFFSLVIAALTAGSLVLAAAGVAVAAPVEPSTLTPPPPDDARCHTAGAQTICDTVLNFFPVNEPAFEAPCGTLYFTGTDLRNGLRFYNADGLLTRRHVTSQLRGTLSLSPTGEGPSLRMTGHMNWWNVWPVPGTEGDGVQTNRGVDIKVQGPGIGSGFMLAGNFPPDEPAHGHFTAFTDESLVLLCEALGQ
jgi:hypothetical protein